MTVEGAGPAGGFRWRHLLLAPHRLAFLLAIVVLLAASSWWAVTQAARAGIVPLPPSALAPGLVHAALMTFGFLPLFFAGFLFTAGPRWLFVPAPATRELAPALLAEAGGWLLWLFGGMAARPLAALGVLLAGGASVVVTRKFAALVRASRHPDRLHAKLACTALALGSLCQLALGACVLLQADEAARLLARTGLWAFVVAMFVTAADRMVPFFGAGVLPRFDVRHPRATLALLLTVCAVEAAAPWLDRALGTAWLPLRAGIEGAAGLLLALLAIAWALRKPLHDRFLVMLHVALAWFALALLLAAASHGFAAATGTPLLPLGSLHALTMGTLGSLVLAMVSRISVAHDSRGRVADGLLWLLFCLLQLAVVLRIAAAGRPAHPAPLLASAAALWAALVAVWGIRLANGFGRPPRYHRNTIHPASARLAA